MNKALLIAYSLTALFGCAPEITREAAPVTTHAQVNKLLDGCDRLGQVSVEYVANKKLSRRENEIHVQDEMKHKAYDGYRADNLVLINTQYVEGGYREKDMIYGRGIAYKCY